MHVNDSQDHIISHDPATHQVRSAASPSQQRPKMSAIILVVLGLSLVITGGAWYFNGKSFDFIKDDTAEFEIEPVDERVIATVGAENIYAQDLNYKKSQVPNNTLTPELEAALIDRLIDESIILQAGASANYVELSAPVFNSPLKDQQARQLLITQVTEKVNEAAAYKKGAYVAIWFMNFEPGPIGYEQGQQIAQEKITQLHQAVSSGTMSIKQAGDAIKNDTSLAQLDPSYKSNAYAEFDTRISNLITFDEAFNEQLLATNENGVTDVALIQDYEQSNTSQPKKDAVYMFGAVTEVQAGEGSSVADWLATQKNNYAVVKN